MVLAGISAGMLGVAATVGAVAGAGMVGITITMDTMIITIIMTMTIMATKAAVAKIITKAAAVAKIITKAAVVAKITTKAAAVGKIITTTKAAAVGVTTTDAIRLARLAQGRATVVFRIYELSHARFHRHADEVDAAAFRAALGTADNLPRQAQGHGVDYIVHRRIGSLRHGG
jgi:hypothetical protein